MELLPAAYVGCIPHPALLCAPGLSPSRVQGCAEVEMGAGQLIKRSQGEERDSWGAAASGHTAAELQVPPGLRAERQVARGPLERLAADRNMHSDSACVRHLLAAKAIPPPPEVGPMAAREQRAPSPTAGFAHRVWPQALLC